MDFSEPASLYSFWQAGPRRNQSFNTMVTLLAAMEKYGRRRGVASLCIGGGEATAVAVEQW